MTYTPCPFSLDSKLVWFKLAQINDQLTGYEMTPVPADMESNPSCDKTRYQDRLIQALPWIVFVLTFILLNHTSDTQTVVTRLAGGQPTTAAQWLWLITPPACAAALISAWFHNNKSRLAASAAATIFIPLLALLTPAALLPLFAVPPALLIADFIISRTHDRPFRWAFLHGALLTFILAYAAHKRQEMLYLLINTAPDPDFDSYQTAAREMGGWNTYLREPLYVWILQLTDLLGGELNPIMQRLTSVATGLGAVAAIYYLCMSRLNVTVAVIAALLYAGQKYLAYNSVRGLRDDSVVLTTMLFIAISWRHLRGPVTWQSLTLWGLTAAACSLLRISSMSYTILIIIGVGIYRFFRDIKPWPLRARWALPVLLPILLMAPYLLHQKKEYGDPFFIVKYNVRFYANVELGGRHPDFPSKQEIAEYAYAGAPMSGAEYIFGYHTMSEIFQRSWHGFIHTFFGRNLLASFSARDAQGIIGVLFILSIIGSLLLLFPRYLFLTINILAFHAPLFFLASFPYFDPRLLMVATAFICIAIASSIGLPAGFAYRYLASPEESGPVYGKIRKSDVSAPSRRRKKKALADTK